MWQFSLPLVCTFHSCSILQFCPVTYFYFMTDFVFIMEVPSSSTGFKKSVAVLNFNHIIGRLDTLPYRICCMFRRKMHWYINASHVTIFKLTEWVEASAIWFNLPCLFERHSPEWFSSVTCRRSHPFFFFTFHYLACSLYGCRML